jgi:hypothetical protein
MPGKGQGQETDSFQTMPFNQPQDIDLERKGGLFVPGGQLIQGVLVSSVAVDCI